jgi:hypothetical protein
MAEPVSQGDLVDFAAVTSRTFRFISTGDFVTLTEASNSADGRSYDYNMPAVADMPLTCVQEVSRSDTGYWRQVIYEAIAGNCVEDFTRTSLVGGNAETWQFRVYPSEEPPVLGVYFDMDASLNREISMQKGGYATVRLNEAATAGGYAWDIPTEDAIAALTCVDLLDANYGDYKAGFIQYLFIAKDVSAHCTDTIEVKRSAAYTACTTVGGCTETVTISVSTLVAADPTATSVSIIEAGDSAEVIAAKTLCEEDDQRQWDRNTASCVNKCLDTALPWFNSATNKC